MCAYINIIVDTQIRHIQCVYEIYICTYTSRLGVVVKIANEVSKMYMEQVLLLIIFHNMRSHVREMMSED